MVVLLDHFILCLHYCNLQAWWNFHKGRIHIYQCDYVLVLERQMFDTVVIQEQQNFASNHFTLHA